MSGIERLPQLVRGIRYRHQEGEIIMIRKFSVLAFALVFSLTSFASADVLMPGYAQYDVKTETVLGDSYAVEPRASDFADCIFDVSGIDSNDGLFAAINERFLVDVAACIGLPSGSPVTMNGIGWNVTIFADSPSWRSEMAVYFDDSALSGTSAFYLAPGAGIDSPGTSTLNSGDATGPAIKLLSVGLPDLYLSDGLLYIEFFETFVDYPNDWDGIWTAGFLRIQAYPEPATLGLLAIGGLLLRRRR